MKKEVVILIAAAALVGIALFVFLREDKDPGQVPLEELTVDEKRGRTLLNAAQQACLSGESTDAGVKLDLESDFVSRFNAGTGVRKDKTRGAVNYVDEQIRSIQDQAIRDCLEERWPKIEACLMGDCQAALAPTEVDFQFTYELPADNLNLDPNHVAFGLQFRSAEQVLFMQPGQGYYVETLPLLPKGKTLVASIYGVVRESYLLQRDERILLCLNRADPVPTEGRSTRYNCRQGSCERDPATLKFFETCPAPLAGAPGTVFSLFSSAWADSHVKAGYWAIPTLEVLQAREDLFGIGYTRFRVEAQAPLHADYDGYFFDLSVNGQPARINGMPGSFQVRTHDFTQPIVFEFGLQNLNFTGANSGCDDIELTLNFVRDGEPAGEPVHLSRTYVALRDAREAVISAGGADYRWTGKYQRAPREYDTEVFTSSLLLRGELDLEANADRISTMKEQINAMKRQFDALGLEFEGRPLVAVIRPPLTQVSYGLAAGIVEPTGQVRFTFERGVANRLADFLVTQHDRAPNAIKSEKYLYSIRGDAAFMASPPVCT